MESAKHLYKVEGGNSIELIRSRESQSQKVSFQYPIEFWSYGRKS